MQAQALKGIRVLEFGGLAPVPYCGLLLADFGADVIRVNRTSPEEFNDAFLARGKRSIQLDLKSPLAIDILKRIIPKVDVLIDPFRPGVMEKLGLGPENVTQWNDSIVYARLTGFGQTGSMAQKAGHDINYLSITGALSSIKRKNEKPLAPVNYLADFAGGGLFCAYGIVLALFERTRSGKGQVIDAAMSDGVNHLSTFLHKFHESGLWDASKPGENVLDSGAPFYDTYETQDGKYMAVGAIEPKFYQALTRALNCKDDLPSQMDMSGWNDIRDIFTSIFKTKTQAEWTQLFATVDACVTPVLELPNIMQHPHNQERQSIHNTSDPAPCPRLSRTPGIIQHNVSHNGQDTEKVLKEFEIPMELISRL